MTSHDDAGTMTLRERQELDQYEGQIASGLKDFVRVGTALLRIRDERLYRGGHATFEDYLLARWSLTRRHGYRLMDAAAAAINVCPNGTHGPASERVARELTGLPPEVQQQVWAQATAESERPTAALVAELAAAVPEARVTREAVEESERRVIEAASRDARKEAVAALLRCLRKAARLAGALDAGEQEEAARLIGRAAEYLEGLG
jgi:hypothetical protein